MGSKIDTFEASLKSLTNQVTESKPVIFDLSIHKDQETLQTLIEKGNIQHVTDDFTEQLKELFQVQNPTLVYTPDFETQFQKFLDTKKSTTPLMKQGKWIYFPWISNISHILPEQEFFSVRTARNRNLIN